MARQDRALKRESTTAFGGLATPAQSFKSSSATPKREIEEIVDLTSVSDIAEEPAFTSHHGLPVVSDEMPTSSTRSRAPGSSHQTTRAQPTPFAMPPSPQGLEFVGKKVKILVDAISDLQKFGLEQVAQLPELVLVGDQSAGKSSLMSALTEVQLPRDQGICTKCPANIKTSPAAEWSCTVSLQQYYRYENPHGKMIRPESVTKRNPFPPWVEQTLEVKPFLTINDKSQLEHAIKWAQIALLNHDTNHEEFIPNIGSRARPERFQFEKDNTEAKFSPNLIAVEISGPGLPALSFYDLPGIFRVAPDPKDQYLAKVIENLAVKYIQRPSALIIWTLAMKTDPSNSSTGMVIQDCKASNRCVGVLTNPDHLLARHIEYEKVLRGEAHIVGHGYFVTKQPGEDASIKDGPNYHSQARVEEMQFFNSNDLWTGQWSEFRERCGTTAIQKFLSTELARQIAASIPSITEKINTRTLSVTRELEDIPDLPDRNVQHTVTRLLAEFSSEVRNVMEGNSKVRDIESFQNLWTRLADQFRQTILHIKPMIRTTHESDRFDPDDVIDLISDDEDSSRPSTPSTSLKRWGSFSDQPASRRIKHNVGPIPFHLGNSNGQNGHSSVKRENGAMHAPATPRGSVIANRKNPLAHTHFADMANLGKGFIDVGAIRTYIANHQQPGMPGRVAPETYNQLCMLAVTAWDRPLKRFMDVMIGILHHQLDELLRLFIGKYEQTELYKAATKHLTEFIDELGEQQRRAVNDLYELETYRLFTTNNVTIHEYEKKELEGLQESRQLSRAKAYVERQLRNGKEKKLDENLSSEERMKEIDRRARLVIVKSDVLGPDPFQKEIEVAAYVRGYYKTAALRFVDSVCLNVNGVMLRKIHDNIMYFLEGKLGVLSRDGEEICRNLMEEDFAIGNRRRKLKLEKEKLLGFAARLQALVEQIEQPDDDDDTSSDQTMNDFNTNGHHNEAQQNAIGDIEMEDDGDDTIVAESIMV